MMSSSKGKKLSFKNTTEYTKVSELAKVVPPSLGRLSSPFYFTHFILLIFPFLPHGIPIPSTYLIQRGMVN